MYLQSFLWKLYPKQTREKEQHDLGHEGEKKANIFKSDKNCFHVGCPGFRAYVHCTTVLSYLDTQESLSWQLLYNTKKCYAERLCWVLEAVWVRCAQANTVSTELISKRSLQNTASHSRGQHFVFYITAEKTQYSFPEKKKHTLFIWKGRTTAYLNAVVYLWYLITLYLLSIFSLLNHSRDESKEKQNTTLTPKHSWEGNR